MRFVRAFVLVSAISLFFTSAASSMTCRDWTRLGEGQKSAAIDDMIRSAVAGQGGRSYGVNRAAVERCMYGESRNIEYDFDDTCSDSRSVSMQALNTLFKHYIWNCVN
jgi:hypothetical protein